jgi:hypothetical protein
MRRLGRVAGALALVGVVGVAGGGRSASAANGNKPRVEVIWTAAQCAGVVDRSVSPIVHFDYTIVSEEDPDDRTADEVDDSRTHQFFAFRRQDAGDALPTWISHADIVRASAVDPEVVEANIDPEAILEDTTRFAAGDWVRITPDDARVPITFAQAGMGVDWDTGAVEPGTYQIYGYTWEPVLNKWSLRAGFVKVIASASEAAAAGPSIALAPDEAVLTAGTAYAVQGCADVQPGTTVTLEWGATVGTAEPDWQPVVADGAIASGALDLPFTPPDEAGGQNIKLRVTVTDAAGRTYTAYSPKVLAVEVNPNPSDDGGGGGCAVAPSHIDLAWLAMLLSALPMRSRRRTTGEGC